MNTGDLVKFVHISAVDYANLEEKDDATVYFIVSPAEMRIGVGDTLFANYVPAHCTDLSLSTYSESIGVGESFVLVVYTEPANSSDPLSVSSSNSNVTISPTSSSNRFTITGSAVGTTDIVVTCGEFTKVCTVDIHRAYIYTEHVLVENYNPDGAKFKYTAPISLVDGQYIEISIDLSTVTGTKENIIGIGQTIDTWSAASSGPRIQMYVTATNKRAISVDLILNDKSRRPLYTSPDTNLLIRVDSSGVWLNGDKFYFDTNLRATPTLTYEVGIDAFLALSSYDIGSQEGANRSHANYNYIKYFTTE